jgi:hypothetical protein
MPERRTRIATPWEFLSEDDKPAEDEEEEVVGPEQAAMHLETPGPLSPAHDAARSDVELGSAGDHGDMPPELVTYFDDEASEVDEDLDLDEEDHDIEDLLIVQHYLADEEEEDDG